MCTLLVAALATALSMTASTETGCPAARAVWVNSANPEITITADPKGGYDVRSGEKSIETIYPNVDPGGLTQWFVRSKQDSEWMMFDLDGSGSIVSGDLARHYSPVLGKLSPTWIKTCQIG
jgi:hypothetical protein